MHGSWYGPIGGKDRMMRGFAVGVVLPQVPALLLAIDMHWRAAVLLAVVGMVAYAGHCVMQLRRRGRT